MKALNTTFYGDDVRWFIGVVESNKAGFAFPSQSLYVESLPNEKPEIFNPKS